MNINLFVTHTHTVTKAYYGKGNLTRYEKTQHDKKKLEVWVCVCVCVCTSLWILAFEGKP